MNGPTPQPVPLPYTPSELRQYAMMEWKDGPEYVIGEARKEVENAHGQKSAKSHGRGISWVMKAFTRRTKPKHAPR